jgi:hypothetical protein
MCVCATVWEEQRVLNLQWVSMENSVTNVNCFYTVTHRKPRLLKEVSNVWEYKNASPSPKNMCTSAQVWLRKEKNTLKKKSAELHSAIRQVKFLFV